jgi:hypothetical protein
MSYLYQALAEPDRRKTQAMYNAKYAAINTMPIEAMKLICWRKPTLHFKGQILAMLSDDMTTLEYAPPKQAKQVWQIHWLNNNIPTQIEWERRATNAVIRTEFRVLVDGSKFVLLSF